MKPVDRKFPLKGIVAALGTLLILSGCSQSGDSPRRELPEASSTGVRQVPESLRMGGAKSVMSFFITSTGMGKGGDLGGLSGADAHCQKLATAEGAGDHTWRAYLSTAASQREPA